MLTRLRHRAHGQEGFTLIELLVVILIIGILAAVAIPAFLNQKGKAQDANVKSDINTAQTAEESYNTTNSAGGYAAVTAGSNALITSIEPTLKSAITSSTEKLIVEVPAGTTNAFGATAGGVYDVNASSPSGVAFTLTKYSDGTVQRTCNVPSGTNPSGCSVGSTGSGNGTW